MTHKLTLSEVVAETRQSMKVAVPLILFRAIIALSGFFASVMLADLGREAMATHALTWTIYLTIIVFFIGLFSSISVLIAQSFGAKDYYSIKIGLAQGLLLGIISVPIMMALFWVCPVVLVWTNQDPVIIELMKPALRAFIWTLLPFAIITVVQQFFIGINKSYLVTLMSVLSVPIQIFFFYVFIFGKFGFPQLGISSVGYGIAISNYLLIIPFLIYMFYAKQLKPYVSFHWWRIDPTMLLGLIRLGLPLGLMHLMEAGLLFVVAIMMGKLGANILAAYHISYQYFMPPLLISIAIIQSTAVRVGIEVGRNNRRSVRFSAAINIIIGLALAMCFSFIYINLPELAISCDIDINSPATQDLVSEASKFLPAVGILILVDSLRLSSSGALRGIKDTTIPMIINFIGFWCIAFPVSYLFGFQLNLGGTGIWWGVIIGTAFSAFILFFRFNRISKHINLEALIVRADKPRASNLK
jgi:MATE family multidrug resistance protein